MTDFYKNNLTVLIFLCYLRVFYFIVDGKDNVFAGNIYRGLLFKITRVVLLPNVKVTWLLVIRIVLLSMLNVMWILEI